MNKDAFYFPHFSGARHDRKLKRAMKHLGIEAYALFFMLLEVLREQDQLSYPMEDIDLLADEFGTSEQKVRVIICNYGLFEVDEREMFFSPKFIEYMTPYLESKHRNRLNGIKGNLIRHGYAKKDEIDVLSDAEIVALNENKVHLSGGGSGGDPKCDRKKRKEKESKVKESKESIPTLLEVQDYFKQNGFPVELATRAYKMYNASVEDNPKLKYWRDSRDNPIKNWKLKMQSVWFKPENQNDLDSRMRKIIGE